MKRRNPETFLQALWRLEDALCAAGMLPMPIWWREALTAFYRSGKRRFVLRKGRRVYASTCVAPRLAVAEMLFGEHAHVPGSPPLTFAFLSVKRGEAADRIRGVKAILDILSERYTTSGDAIELESRPARFEVVTANFRTNVGGTIAMAWCDEVARWRDDDSGANPAEQVIGSLAPALATLPDAKLFLVSSPLGGDDYHAKSFDMGDTPAQFVAFGETWTINPSLTREQCAELEPDPKMCSREYGAQPWAGASPAFDSDAVANAFRLTVPPESRWLPPLGLLDSAAGKSARSDSMTWGCARYCILPTPPAYLEGLVPQMTSVCNVDREQLPESVRHYWKPGAFTYPDPRNMRPGVLRDELGHPIANPEASRGPTPVLRFECDGVRGVFQPDLVGGALWKTIGDFFRVRGASALVCDTYGAAHTLSELGYTSRYQLQVTPVDWTAELKAAAVYRLRQLMRDNALSLAPHDQLRRELLGFNERISPSGVVTYSARGSGKDDHVSLLVNMTIGESLRLLPGSDLFAPSQRSETGR